ncbi:MAG: hypothetical protein ACKVJR_07820, partial [Flavobacteriales bacterium]
MNQLICILVQIQIQMLKYNSTFIKLVFLLFFNIFGLQAQQKFSRRQIQEIKTETLKKVQERHKNTQVMIDKVFSFAELGFQEYESSAYLTSILENAGFI